MQSILLPIIIAATVVTLAYIFYQYSSKSKRNMFIQNNKTDQPHKFIRNTDYTEERLSLEEKIAKSWEFLTNITNQVLEKFSKPDQEAIKDASTKMAKHGMVYHHDIDLEIKQGMSRVQNINKKRETNKDTSRSQR